MMFGTNVNDLKCSLLDTIENIICKNLGEILKKTIRKDIMYYEYDLEECDEFARYYNLCFSLYDGILLEGPSEEYSDFILSVDEDLSISGESSQIFTIYHFDMLYKNIHLFNETEQKEWKNRMSKLFESNQQVLFLPFAEYIDYLNFDIQDYDKFVFEWEYTFVGILDLEWLSNASVFTCYSDFKSIYDFAENYLKFYKDLEYEINAREEVA